jgi:hypothetical protein
MVEKQVMSAEDVGELYKLCGVIYAIYVEKKIESMMSLYEPFENNFYPP